MEIYKEWEVCGSDGELVINRNGFVLRRTGYNHIDRFDMESMHPSMAADLNKIGAIDILYIGHWYKDGSYEEPIGVSEWGGLTEAAYIGNVLLLAAAPDLLAAAEEMERILDEAYPQFHGGALIENSEQFYIAQERLSQAIAKAKGQKEQLA